MKYNLFWEWKSKHNALTIPNFWWKENKDALWHTEAFRENIFKTESDSPQNIKTLAKQVKIIKVVRNMILAFIGFRKPRTSRQRENYMKLEQCNISKYLYLQVYWSNITRVSKNLSISEKKLSAIAWVSLEIIFFLCHHYL